MGNAFVLLLTFIQHTCTHTCVLYIYCSYSCACDLTFDHTPEAIGAALEQLAHASSQHMHVSSVAAKQQKEVDHMEDLTLTADAYQRSSLLMRCFTAWVHFVALAGKTDETQVQVCSVVARPCSDCQRACQ